MKKIAQNKKVIEKNQKTCLVSRQAFPREEMLRFVVEEETATLYFDVSEKLPGRGLWIHADKGSLDQAVARKVFSKAARKQIQVPADFSEKIYDALKAHCLSLVGLARKSGVLTAGFENVKKALESKKVALAFEASDGSTRETSRLFRPEEESMICRIFSRAELSLITGQDAQTHVALFAGPLAERILKNIYKLKLFFEDEKKG